MTLDPAKQRRFLDAVRSGLTAEEAAAAADIPWPEAQTVLARNAMVRDIALAAQVVADEDRIGPLMDQIEQGNVTVAAWWLTWADDLEAERERYLDIPSDRWQRVRRRAEELTS